MGKAKVYSIENQKGNLVYCIGTSKKEVREYIDENKYDLDLDLPYGGHFKIEVEKLYTNINSFYDEVNEQTDFSIESVEREVKCEFITSKAYNTLIEQKNA